MVRGGRDQRGRARILKGLHRLGPRHLHQAHRMNGSLSSPGSESSLPLSTDHVARQAVRQAGRLEQVMILCTKATRLPTRKTDWATHRTCVERRTGSARNSRSLWLAASVGWLPIERPSDVARARHAAAPRVGNCSCVGGDRRMRVESHHPPRSRARPREMAPFIICPIYILNSKISTFSTACMEWRDGRATRSKHARRVMEPLIRVC
jgi:hypothetical protein